MASGQSASAQERGGLLRASLFDSPASLSIHEESTVFAEGPAMGLFNNLVTYKEDVPQAGLNSIVPDLALEWAWGDGGKELTFKLRQGVKWHDGKPFTAQDVKCTFDLLQGKSPDKLRLNPRKAWYRNLDEVAPNGDYEVAFRLKRPQPAFIVLLASGFTPIYPCHVAAAQMRQHPIGTGPFKFTEFKPNDYIKVTRNPEYWKQDRPYLDDIEWTIIKNVATAQLAFVSGKFDLTSPYVLQVPVLNDTQTQLPRAVCQLVALNANRNVIINRSTAPFDNKELRRAVALTLDRRAFIDTLTQGKGDIGGAMLPPPEGVWGMPPDVISKLPGYDPDIETNRAEARGIMEKLGYGPDKRLPIKVAARNIAAHRDPAVILIDQLRQIYIDAELDPVDTANWYPKIARKDYMIGLNLTGNGLDDPDQAFYENYACGSGNNPDGYCNPGIDKLIDEQSVQSDQVKRKQLVWEIERRLAEDVARPVLYHNRSGTCWQPYVRGYTPMVNSAYNGWRFEEVWLER